MENKCLCKICKNQDKYGYCNKLKDECSMKCIVIGDNCNGMTVCSFYDNKKVDGD